MGTASPADELAAIAARLYEPLAISARDVRSWLDGSRSERPELRESRRRRAQAVELLFGHPLTPPLAAWLTRFAPPPHLEVALVKAHHAAALIKDGEMEPELAARALRRSIRRSWAKQRLTGARLIADPPSLDQPSTKRVDSLAVEAIEVLATAGVRPGATQLAVIAEAVDQAVEYLAEEAERDSSKGKGVFDPPPPSRVSSNRRASLRVATGHPAGSQLRQLLFGGEGLVAYALYLRAARANGATPPTPKPSVVRAWSYTLSQFDAPETPFDCGGLTLPVTETARREPRGASPSCRSSQ
jgi:hypothetical protein